MPGFTKNQSIKFMTGTQESFTEYIKKIIPTLPIKYNIERFTKDEIALGIVFNSQLIRECIEHFEKKR